MSGVLSLRALLPRAAARVCAAALLQGLVGCAAPLEGTRAQWQCAWLMHCALERELRAAAQSALPKPQAEPPRPRGEVGPIQSELVQVDYFQGLLVRAGVPPAHLPKDGRRLTPDEALQLLSWVVAAEVPLRDFGPWRMAAHLLWEVHEGGKPVSRKALHGRMRRFAGLLVLRPDGCLVRATTGVAVQQVGTVEWRDDALRAERFEVGPFYTVRNGMLYAVDADLEVHLDTVLSGVYAPEEGTLGPALEGAGQAVVDTVAGILSVALHPIQTLEGLARLPGAVRVLLENSPEYWEHFRAQPHGAQVRAVSRLLTTVLITVGSAGAGSARVATVGSRLGRLGVPVLSLSAQGTLALRRVAVPTGQLATAVGTGASAVYILHMAQAGGGGAGGGGVGGGGGGNKPGRPWPPPPRGPGRWIQKNEGMKPPARKYQSQVAKAPEGWVYRVEHNGERADFDGFPEDVLVDAKGPNYDNKFDDDLIPKHWFDPTGAKQMVDEARRQFRVANGAPIEWHVAEAKAAAAIRELLRKNEIYAIKVIHTPALP